MQLSILLVSVLLAIILITLILRANKEYNVNHFIEDAVLCLDELERHAEQLAHMQTTSHKKTNVKILRARAESHFKTILSAYRALNQDTAISFPVPPAADWLLDNFYIIEEQKSIISRELSEFKHKLPILNDGVYNGLPRIYAIAVEIVAHTDGKLDERSIKSFIMGYQRKEFLLIEELWTLTLMIKLALLEKLSVNSEKLLSIHQEWHEAEAIATKIIEQDRYSCEVLNEYLTGIEKLTPSLVEHMIKKLRKEGSKTLWVIECLDSILVQKSISADILISQEHLYQVTLQISTGNALTSMRMLLNFENTHLVEDVSEVERLLRLDPSGIYPLMDFISRDHYRNRIVKLAKRFDTTEINIARLALENSKIAHETSPQLSPNNHVGHYLVGAGIAQMKKGLSYTACLKDRINEYTKKNAIIYYVAAIIFFSILIVSALFYASYRVRYSGYNSITSDGLSKTIDMPNNTAYLIATIIVAIIALIPASEIVVSILNSVLNSFLCPDRLPKLELKNGIPTEASTMVIVPTLLPNIKRTEELIDNLETFYLANRGKNIYFSLVGDFRDSTEQVKPEDTSIVEIAKKKIDELNNKYALNNCPTFYFFCRERRFNTKQDSWMGWERKGGLLLSSIDFCVEISILALCIRVAKP